MKASKFTVAGVVLLLCVALAATGLQVFGPGLVTSRPAPPRTATTPQGVAVTVTERPAVVFHLKTIVPLAALAAVGLLCIALARREHPDDSQQAACS